MAHCRQTQISPQLRLGHTHVSTQGPTDTFPKTHTNQQMLHNTCPTSLTLQNLLSLHPPFTVFSFCTNFQTLLLPLPISCPNPLSHHYFSKPSMFATTHPGMEPLSFTLTLMNHSLPLKSPITSNRTVSSPLIFTKLSTHCGTELLVITFLSLTRLSGE